MEKFYPYENWDDFICSKILSKSKDWNYFCDVGACLGGYTNFFKNLMKDKNGKVYSFEANPKNYENIKYLANDNCIVENFAVMDSSKEVTIYAENTNYGQHMSTIFNKERFGIDFKTSYNVPSVTLDEYFKDIRLDCMKIDVEGSEFSVIKGGIETIRNCKFCVIECHWDEDWDEILELLELNSLKFKDLVTDNELTKDYRPYQIYYEKNQKV